MEDTDRQKTITWKDPKNNARDTASISGLDYLTGVKDGTIEPPPIAHLVGYRPAKIEKGYAVFELDPQEYHYNPFSTVHGGITTTVLDTAMTACVLTTLPKGITCSTVEIKTNFIRPITAKTGTLYCESTPINIGKKLATVQGTLKDKNGTLYAHGTSTLIIIKIGHR